MTTYDVTVNEDGTFWCLDGHIHREDGPACEWANGNKYWYQNGKLHREDGSAIERANGDKEWYQNGHIRREDGPACEWANGSKYWYLNDQELTEDEFNERTNPAKEMTIAELESALGYKIKVVK